MEKVHCRKTLGTETQGSFQAVLDSSSEHPLVARTADRVWAAALSSVTDLSANSSKLAGSHSHSVLLYFSIQSPHASQQGHRTASTCKNTLSDPKHFADKAALLGAQEGRQQGFLLGPKCFRARQKSVGHTKAPHQTSSPPTGT